MISCTESTFMIYSTRKITFITILVLIKPVFSHFSVSISQFYNRRGYEGKSGEENEWSI